MNINLKNETITENKLEHSAIELLQSLGWEYIHGSVISPEGEKPECELSIKKAYLVTKWKHYGINTGRS